MQTTPIETACRAIGISPHVLEEWVKMGVPLLNKNNSLNHHRVMQIALMFELAKQRIDAYRAACWSVCFSDTRDEDRDPGELFADGDTLLVARSGDEFADIVRADEAGSLLGTTNLHLNPIMDRVNAALA